MATAATPSGFVTGALNRLELSSPNTNEATRPKRSRSDKDHSPTYELVTLAVPGVDPGVKQLSSIPLILPDNYEYDSATMRVKKTGPNRSKLKMVKEAQQMLMSITEPISVLAICGPARTGKSYILSRVLGQPDAFELGHSMDPQTHGIWVGTQILRGKDKRGKPFCILLLDSEGIDAVSSEKQHDAGIFVLTILLCSQLVYNSLSVPYKKDLEKLECFSRLASSIRVRKGTTDADDEEGGVDAMDNEYFPDFLWLLRDVSLEIPDGMGPTEYIKTRVLSRSKKLTATKGDATAETIMAMFPRIEAFTLPTPHSDTDIMQNIAAHTDKLSHKFQEGVQIIIEKLKENCAMKQKRGFDKMSVVTGELMGLMVEQYVEAINDPNAIPEMQSTWDAVMSRVVKETLEKLLEQYKMQMEAMVEAASTVNGQILPLEEHEAIDGQGQSSLFGIHDMVFNEVNAELMAKLGRFGVGISLENTIQTFQTQIVQYKTVTRREGRVDYKGQAICGGEFWKFIEENNKLSTKYCTDRYHSLFKVIKGKIDNQLDTYTFEQFGDDLEHLHAVYDAEAIGPAKYVVLKKLDDQVATAHKDNLRNLKGYQEKVFLAQQEAKLKENEARLKNEEVQRLVNESKNLKSQHEQNVKEMSAAFDRQMQQMKEEEREWKETEMKRIQNLQEANFKQLSSTIQNANSEQMKTFQTMMNQMGESQKQHAQQMAQLMEKLKPPPPPPAPRRRKKGGCVLM